ncbi:MAG: hypothetical protein ACI8QS_001048 [Planctomycetota bacterium]|jgi:hypothetical protein
MKYVPNSPESRSGRSGVALLILILVGATAVVIGLNANYDNKQDSAPTEPERPDIFGDIPADVAPTRKPRSGSGDGSTYSGGSIEDTADWDAAVEVAGRAEIALREAIAAQDSGAAEQVKQKGRQARELYDRALELANPWLEENAEVYGREHPQVARADRKTRAWVKELVVLRRLTR